MKTLKYFMALGVIGAAALGTSRPAQAADADHNFSLGVQLGVTSVSNGVGAGLAYAAEGLYFFSPSPFGIGAYVRRGNHSDDISSVFYGAEGFYKLDSLFQGLRAGVILGAGSFKMNGVTGNSALDVGFKAAYDYMIPGDLPISVGGDITLSWTKPGDTTLFMFTPMVTGRWWF